MRDSLIQITQQIIDSNEIVVNKFQVFEESDTLPEIIECIEFQSEYLVCLWVDCNDALIAQRQYESFLHKPVGVVKNHQQSVLYWFEGFKRKATLDTHKEDQRKPISKEKAQVESLKNDSILPTWLQQRIFEIHDAKYAPDHKRYEKNLELSDDELKVYLGTYFPRSYGESFCVFDNIFNNRQYSDLASKEEISILDIGCGTGGNLIGLLVALNKYSIATKKVNILAIDGNLNALRILSDLVESFAPKATFAIKLITKTQSIHSAKDLEWLSNSTYDFIMSFKMGCELIAEGNANFYYDLTTLCLPMLSESGLFLLLDVTTKVGITYNPILLNTQINRAIKDLIKYQTLIPITCGEFEKECSEQCFTQRTFFISHFLKTKDKSKIAYRILANADFVKQISLYDCNCSYINILENDEKTGTYCPNSQGELVKDNYRI
ncbi:class I SAM-dependent methyltransferase [Thermophagus sp. OGC60D27]|uniref:class I SAM-dependent methyltransferase n=1 Tax=Thermophagus sp. OGC60D27 TaxID=3458415 RepID=UPI00403787F4